MKEQKNNQKIIKKQPEIQIRFKSDFGQRRKVKTWTKQDDQRLLNLYNQFPKKWNKIAQMMVDRNQNQCLHRYRRLTLQNDHKKIWSPQEDETVLKLYQKYGKNWKMIALNLKSKTGKQIRQRFINKLDPQIKRQQFSRAQDLKIVQLLAKYGSKWSQISRHLPGRPENKIKNRYYSHIQKNYDIIIKKEESSFSSEDKQENNQISTKSYPFVFILNQPKNIQTNQFEIYLEKNKSNKQNEYQKQSQISQKSMKIMDFRKIYSQDCKKQQSLQSLQQINEPNEIIGYRQYCQNQDIFYFQQN